MGIFEELLFTFHSSGKYNGRDSLLRLRGLRLHAQLKLLPRSSIPVPNITARILGLESRVSVEHQQTFGGEWGRGAQSQEDSWELESVIYLHALGFDVSHVTQRYRTFVSHAINMNDYFYENSHQTLLPRVKFALIVYGVALVRIFKQLFGSLFPDDIIGSLDTHSYIFDSTD